MIRLLIGALSMALAVLALAGEPTPEEARAIARDAYVYGFPLVDSYRIQYTYFQDRSSPEFKAPWNHLHSEARLYTPADTALQSPNADTPYSQLGADLRAEPLVLSVPDMEPERYYSLQFVDAYTYNFDYVGSRSNGGNKAARYLLAGPDWHGPTPPGIARVIRADTQFAFVFYRTQLFNAEDLEAVRKIQAGFTVQPLSAYLGQPAPVAPAIDFVAPLTAEQERRSPDFFKVLNFVLSYCPTLPEEKPMMERFARLNIGPGHTFDLQTLSPSVRKAVEEGMADAWSQSMAEFERLRNAGKVSSADVFGSREHMAGNYLYRMAGAALGIYGNSAEEALYPTYYMDAQGSKLDGSRKRYTLRFEKDQLPPVRSFWSLTPYTLPQRTLVANPLQRYLINSAMLPQLQRDADGGITLHLQSEPPQGPARSNWLPVPKGPFLLAMRLYWPMPEALSGEWRKPSIQVVD
ncbi:DUF1254 domain-containing protein [Pseudomonas sp. LA21]|uniref:DUF1254 domain-containing protein n=1 Tax=unclassified Pseudomonas TaxID=196821 RepID=UPI001FB5AE54|nr:DUF1254 domain-containing protein [Pseudomonas sp. LA21]MCJ1887049.1 DUF1254 domain-containing protein [Pseudomonas sp. LA21]